MEEKVRTDGQQTTENEEKKLSYDELMNVAVQLQQQNQQLQNQLRQTNGIEKRLYFLFEVLKNAELFGDFAKECVEEVKAILIIPKEETNQPAQEEK